MVYDVTVGRFGTFYVNPFNDGLDENDSSGLTHYTTKYPEGTPVMQYTGLKDKNGKEMFSKDIIEMVGGQRGVIEWVEELGCFQIVIFENGEEYTATIYSRQEDGTNMNRKVIGNIYENPELLK
jgi:uncharacterized phage protein (TIGR01671 family)